MIEIISGRGAAIALGVTPARVSQFTSEGRLEPVRNERGQVVGYLRADIELLKMQRRRKGK